MTKTYCDLCEKLIGDEIETLINSVSVIPSLNGLKNGVLRIGDILPSIRHLHPECAHQLVLEIQKAITQLKYDTTTSKSEERI